jgi:hypothetical protein
MFNKTTVLANIAVTVGLVGAAHADPPPVDFEPIGVGGVQWIVSPAGFGTPLNYGSRTAQAYSVPYSASARSGCFVIGPDPQSTTFSPWLRVGHGDGSGNVFPEIYSTWEAVIDKRVSPNATVFTLRVDIQHVSGPDSRFEKQVSSGLYSLTPIFFPTPDTILYWGDLDSSLQNASVVQTFPVRQGDLIRVSVCDLARESTIDVRRIVVQTFPRDGF